MVTGDAARNSNWFRKPKRAFHNSLLMVFGYTDITDDTENNGFLKDFSVKLRANRVACVLKAYKRQLLCYIHASGTRQQLMHQCCREDQQDMYERAQAEYHRDRAQEGAQARSNVA